MRRLLVPVLLVSVAWAQDVPEGDLEERDEVIPVVRIHADRGPVDHLGWGTLEDLYIDLGAGAAVSVFSGNLIVSTPTFVRADLPPDGRFALTYNHLDADGSPEIAPGWSWDLGRAVMPGPWGDRVLVDADGFRDTFFAGQPPTDEEASRLADDVVRAWRRSTPARQRRETGGESSLREMMAADPLFFGEMRSRFLGPAPEPPLNTVWRSGARGARSMVKTKDSREMVVTRHDGGTETYSELGGLVRVDPADGPPIELERDNGRMVGVDVDGRRAMHVDRDSYDRIDRIRAAQGGEVHLAYVGPVLHRVETPRGQLRFTYDRSGRLLSMQGPEGGIDVTYDDASGRVLRASGPRGGVSLGDPTGTEARIAVRVDLDGETFAVSWDADRRERQVLGAGSSERVRFGRAGLPVEVDADGLSWAFAWSPGGRLTEASLDGRSVRWERGEVDEVKAVVDAGGARAQVRSDSRKEVAGWSEPEGHRTDVVLDRGGRPERLAYPGGGLEQVWRDRSGRLKAVERRGIGGVTIQRDRRGFVKSLESAVGATAAVELDAAGRLIRFEPPTGGRIELAHDAAGRLTSLSDGGSDLLLRYDRVGLVGWRGGYAEVDLSRDADGEVTDVTTERGRWSARRSRGRVDTLDFGEEASLDYDARGRFAGWTRGGEGLTLRWGRDDAVEGWSTPARGDITRQVDRWGRTVGIARASARWTFTRDRSGRARTMVAPAGGTWRLDRDQAGRLSLIAGPRNLRWRLERDAAGRLQGLRVGESTWSVRRDRAARVTDLAEPGGRRSELALDRAGRWTGMKRPGLRPLSANYSTWGPTAVGEARRDYDGAGALRTWARLDPAGAWFLDRGVDGGVATVGWRRGRSVEARGVEVRRRVSRPGSGVLRSGPWTLAGRAGRIDSVLLDVGADSPLRWSIRRDRAGRAERLELPDGRAAEVSLGPDGDPRSLTVGDVAWSFERDSFGRVLEVRRGDAFWSVRRDPLGRASLHAVEEPGGEPFEVRIDPLDDSRAGDTTLAEALGVEVDDAVGPERPAGSVAVEVHVEGGGRVLAFDEIRTGVGRFAGVEGFWGTTGTVGGSDLDVSADPTLAVGSGLESPADAIGDVLGDLLDPVRGLDLRWGGERLLSSTGSALLPSPVGRGAGAAVTDGVGYLRLAAADGGTVTWLGPGGTLDGLRLPTPSGAHVTPTGWLGHPTPGGGADPTLDAALVPAPAVGPAAAVEAWWAGFALRPDELAILPPGLSVSARGWVRPRIDRQSTAADLPSQEPPTDAGAALPPVPGLDRLLPGRRGSRTVTLRHALVLSGDLPASALEGVGWLDEPADWTLEIPGAALLLALAERRAAPSSPPRAVFEGLAGASPALDGLLTDAGRRFEDADLHDAPHLAVRGLPAGTAALRPGRSGLLPGARESIPGDARAAAVHALSDDPLLPGAAAREAARSDGVVLSALALERRPRLPTSAWLTGPTSQEAWAVDTPGGVRAVVDRRGRLLSLSARSRESEAWRRSGTAHAGRAALHPFEPLPEAQALAVPTYLPAPSDRPETRQGLAATEPERPLSALGVPLLPGLIGVQDPELGPVDLWRYQPDATAPPGVDPPR